MVSLFSFRFFLSNYWFLEIPWKNKLLKVFTLSGYIQETDRSNTICQSSITRLLFVL